MKFFEFIFFQKVNNPQDFGVLHLDEEQNLIDIVEKPKDFISDLAVTGIYTFDDKFFQYFKSIDLSDRILKEDKTLIEDLIKAAHSNAKSQLKSKTSEEIAKATGGLGIADFKWPL